ncbi:carboxypeptidase regulatory-like domain-containing protein [Pseudomonas sp. H1h]|uniref:carboxypeptidase regulatory-like domain-containing protein n=1 Tax=Pseudomonas sp. H1h TaxID=1397280 RepID=UPI00046A4DE1|nr:carboxypeptidase regulatory-like domain-containing protein [Pseudomonas sp. H1h]
MKLNWKVLGFSLLAGFITAPGAVYALTVAIPVIQTPINDSSVYRLPWLTGTGVPGATVEVAKSQTASPVLATVLVDPSGRWAVRSRVELPLGKYSIVSRQTLNGVTSAWGLNIALNVTDIPPPPVIETPTQGSNSYRRPRIAGSGIPGATVQVVRSHYASPVLGSALVDSNGHWQVYSAVELAVGPYSFVGRQSVNGKWSDWGVNIQITSVDTLDPPQISTPVANSLSERQPLLSGMGVPGATVRIVRSMTASPVLASTKVNEKGRWEVRSAIALPIGPYSIVSQQTLNGNTSEWGTNIPITVTDGNNSGQQMADELNRLYSATTTTCPGNKAAYDCSGLLVRTVDDSTAFHAWNPSPSAIGLGGVSFSYMRVGIGMDSLQGSRTQGLILEPGQSFTANGGYPLQVLCAFPYDGESLRRSANGCGASGDFPQNSGPCAAQNLKTLAAWRTHFQQYKNAPERYRHQCSFAPDQAGFALSLAARDNPGAENQAWRQNEIVIKTWPQNTSNLPIKAFFYFSNATRAVGVEGAKNIQRDFLKATGRRIPVMRITPSPTARDIVSYSQADQGI